MKSIKNNITVWLIAMSCIVGTISGCTLFGLDIHEDYNYEKFVLNDRIDMTAWAYLKTRANGTTANDTIFRWMKKAIDYSGIDTAEYTKPNRTYIFLHNDALRVYNTTTRLITGGLFFTMPIMQKDANGNLVLDPITKLPRTTTATKWEDYSKQTVKNYLLYLIAEGNYNYNNLTPTPVELQTLLPPNSTATKESRLGYVVTPSSVPGSISGSNGTAPAFLIDYSAGGKGFDPEGKFTLQLSNTADSKLFLNGGITVRSSGYYMTNGAVHVWSSVIIPSR